MKYEWTSGSIPFVGLEVQLNKLSETGWEIFQVLAVTNSHAIVVARKPGIEQKKGSKKL